MDPSSSLGVAVVSDLECCRLQGAPDDDNNSDDDSGYDCDDNYHDTYIPKAKMSMAGVSVSESSVEKYYSVSERNMCTKKNINVRKTSVCTAPYILVFLGARCNQI